MKNIKQIINFKRILAMALCLCMIFGILASTMPNIRASSSMVTSQACIDFIKSNEGFLRYPVWDYAQYSVGYGTKCPDNKYDYYMTYGISYAEAEALLRQYVSDFEYYVNRFIDKYNLRLTQNQFDALVSYSYNLGPGWTTSTPANHSFLNAILNGTDEEIIRAFGYYCHAGGDFLLGLMNRRLCEADMYVNGYYSSSNTPRSNMKYIRYSTGYGSVDHYLHAYDANRGTKPTTNITNNLKILDGWYTSTNGNGTKVTVLDSSLSNGKTLYPNWVDFIDTSEPGVAYIEVKVTNGPVNVRTGPGTNNPAIGQASNGQKLRITETQTVGTTLWGKFSKGWLALSYTNYTQALKDYEAAMKEHTLDTLVERVEPIHTATELKAGMEEHYLCPHCNKYFTAGKVEVEKDFLIIPAPVHNYTTQYGYKGADGHADTCACGAHNAIVKHIADIPAATETQAQKCVTCGYVITPKLEHIHKDNLTISEARPADCINNGSIEFYVCSCGKWFKDIAAKEEITDKSSVNILAGHNYGELIAQVDPIHTATELKEGLKAHYFCDKCETYFTAEKVATTLQDLKIVAPKHSYTVVKYAGPDGHIISCACGAGNELAGHVESAPEATEETPVTCLDCGYVIIPALGHIHANHLTHIAPQKASCTVDGHKEYYQCSCGMYYEDAEAKIEITNKDSVIIKAAHNYGTLVAKVDAIHTANELKAGMEAYYFCDKCETYFTDEKIATTREQLVIAQPKHNYSNINGYKESDGHADTCACGAHNAVVKHIANIPAATETEDQVCSVCEYVIANKLGHIHKNHLTKHDANNATCTTDGNIEYYECDCGKLFKDAAATNEVSESAVKIPSPGHKYGFEWQFDKTNHWNECACGEKSNLGAHNDNTYDGRCDKCAYKIGEPATPIATGVVKAIGSLRVRSGPGLGYSTASYLYNDSPVKIFEIKTADGRQWGRVSSGWVAMDYIVLDGNDSENPSQSNTIYGVVKVAAALNVRSGPGSNYDIVDRVYKDDPLEITEKKLVGSTYWGKISTGWINMNYVLVNKDNKPHGDADLSTTRIITADRLRVRSGAGSHYSIITYVYKDTQIEILETKIATNGVRWGRIDKGWIDLTYTQKVS